MAERTADEKPQAVPWGKIALRVFFLALGLVSLYFFLPLLLDLFEHAPQLEEVKWRWFFLMAALMSGAFAAQWALTRMAVPGVSWFVAGTSQLTSNAATKVTPGGPVVGGALYFQMLSVSGVPSGQAAAALAAVGFLSTLVLLSLPGVSVLLAAVSAPIPPGLLPVAVAGTILFFVMFVGVLVLVRFDRPLHALGWVVEHSVAWMAKRLHKAWKVTAESFVVRRDEVVASLGGKWHLALGLAVLNWMLDYLTLVTALVAVGANPRPSLVLLAFAAAAVLGMIPVTPGGLGFVEAGLTATLVIAGIPSSDALLATLAYRMFQFWLPIPAGLVAYILFRRKYGNLSELPST